jgi:hypothetical protein
MEFDNRAASISSTLFSTPRQTSGAPNFRPTASGIAAEFWERTEKGLEQQPEKTNIHPDG